MKELIPKILINSGQLKKEDIKTLSIKNSPDLNLISSNLLHEAITDLMIDDSIEIVDYDFSIYGNVAQIQSIKNDGLVFDVVVRSPMEICALMDQLGSKNPEDVINANKKLKRQFKRKYREYEQILKRRWAKRIHRTYEYSQVELLDILPSELPKPINDGKKRIKTLKDEINKIPDGGKIWFYNPFGMKKPSPVELVRYCDQIVDENGNMDVVQVLNSIGHLKPEKIDNNTIDLLFDEIITYIQFDSEPYEKKELVKKMAIGLSNIKEASLAFEEIIRKMKVLLDEKHEKLSHKELRYELN